MPAVKGSLCNLYVSNGDSPETWSKIGGARSHNIQWNDGVVDVSDKDSAGWSESDYMGLKSIEIQQAGLFKGTPGEQIVNDHIKDFSEDKSPLRVKLVYPGRGSFIFLATVEHSSNAPHDNAIEATYTFRSASGPPEFEAEGT